MAYVIRYDGKRKKYLIGWTAIGPRFGKRADAICYETERLAQAQIATMPMLASVMCDAVEVTDGR